MWRRERGQALVGGWRGPVGVVPRRSWAARVGRGVGAGGWRCDRVGGPALAGGRWECREALEGGGQLARPGPVAVEVQDRLAGVEGEAAGDVQQPVAQPLGLAASELAVD